MINDNELMISNKSYVNKDFATIYPELLDYVKILTNKWNPQTSNESDPGVVLLKLLGFMGDKLNYNVDKNVLEDFVLSCTQESSMRKNLYPLGYNMKYYHSATTKVQFTYIGDALDSSGGSAKSFSLPKLDTVITSDDGSVQFVLTQPVTINTKNIPVTTLVMQGRKETFVVGDSDVVQLENIDSNNRLYFPTNMVAENGVFIHRVDIENEEWTKVDNLNTTAPNQTVFLFGFDSSRGLPYIEFPDDIVDLIGNGLHIDYIITNGRDGNISAKTLTQIMSPDSAIISNSGGKEISFKDENDSSLLIIKNLSATIDGSDPETIDEAYNNFKKTIGTFDTLVTCRDYANAIYNIYDDVNEYYVVSNAQVSDRRDDITYSTGVVSYTEYGQGKINVKNEINKDITAYDLFLYPLNPILTYSIDGYKESFKPLLSTTYIKNRLENSKCASHDYHNFSNEPNSIYALKNILRLDAKIATTHKVNNYERKNIIANVIEALIKKFNARNVDYGYEIPYDTILKTIEQADNRISYVNLLEPEITTNVMKANGDEVPLISSDGLNFLLSILAHNILNGNIELFNYDEDFDYDFGQSKIQNKLMKLTNLKEISTKTEIQLTSGTPVELLSNEVIQLIAPSMVTDIQYSAYTYYHANLSRTILNGENYKLGASECLWIYYTDASTKSAVVKKYIEGEIIQPKGFNLSQTPSSGGGTVEKEINYPGEPTQTISFLSLGAQENINIRKVNKTVFISPTNFYWIRNNENNALFLSSEALHEDSEHPTTITGYEAILGDNEYLFYTDEGFNNLVSLGSGTTIKTNNTFIVQGVTKIPTVPSTSFEEILESGLLSLKEKWYYMNLTKYKNENGTQLEVQENAILTLTTGDTITWTNSSATQPFVLGNELKEIIGDIEYSFVGGDETPELEKYSFASWRIKSRLDINAGKNFAQSIVNSRQYIKFTNVDNTYIELNQVNETFNLNEAYQFIGATTIDVSSRDIITDEPTYPFSVYCYSPQLDTDNKPKNIDRGLNGYATISIKGSDGFDFDVPNVANEYKILMVHVTIPLNSTLTITSTGGGMRLYNTSWGSFGTQLEVRGNGMICIEMEPSVVHLNVVSSDSDDSSTIVIDYLKYINGYTYSGGVVTSYGLNKKLGINDELVDKISTTPGEYTISGVEKLLLDTIKNLDDTLVPKFYYTNRILNSKAIEQNNLLDPLALYDVNNVANKFTISQIDLESNMSSIDVMRSSRL